MNKKQKKLLIDEGVFLTTKPLLKEVNEKGNSVYVVKGKIQEAEVKNANGRIYPKDVLEEAINLYIQNFVDNDNAYGELDHPDYDIVKLSNASHIITKIWWEGNNVIAEIEILDTPSGRIVKSLFESGRKVGISSRALGSVTQVNESTVRVDEDLEMIAWDFVSNPSSPGAWIEKDGKTNNDNSLNENKQKQQLQENPYKKISSLLTELICDFNNKCSINTLKEAINWDDEREFQSGVEGKINLARQGKMLDKLIKYDDICVQKEVFKYILDNDLFEQYKIELPEFGKVIEIANIDCDKVGEFNDEVDKEGKFDPYKDWNAKGYMGAIYTGD